MTMMHALMMSGKEFEHQPSRKKRRVEGENEQPVEGETENEQSHPEIFMAVLVCEDNASHHDDLEKAAPKEEEDPDDFLVPSSGITKFKAFSLCLGLLIGVFIQFSSLGANYLVEQVLLLKDNINDGNTTSTSNILAEQWWGLSLLWSFSTSTVGVILLLALRSLLHETAVCPQSSERDNHRYGMILVLMECHFAVGALSGVCLAWMGTDVVLQAPQHLVHSCVTLCMALGWCKLLATCFPVMKVGETATTANDEGDSNSNDLREHLLQTEMFHEDSQQQQSKKPSRLWVQLTSLFLGSLIGLFIQFSSLGANFLMQKLHQSEDDATTHQAELTFSLMWSIATSSMGIAVLFFIRALMVLSDRGNWLHQHTLMTVECFFATGAVLGLNLAWSMTDFALGLESHGMSSVLTLAGTLLWCKMVLYCCGYCRQEDDNQEANVGLLH